ncbi:hypothetical protein IWW55_006296, partial [Coemansia sp. RSA 2706]
NNQRRAAAPGPPHPPSPRFDLLHAGCICHRTSWPDCGRAPRLAAGARRECARRVSA